MLGVGCGDTLHYFLFLSGSLIFDVDSLGNGRCTLRNNDDSLYGVFFFFVVTKSHAYHYAGEKARIEIK